VIISLKEKGNRIEPGKTTLISGIIMIIFLFFGEGVLSLFGVDVGSFAIAGGIVIFIIGLEMVLGADFFKDSGTIKSASIVPMAFPFIAGAGTLTTLLSLRDATFTTCRVRFGECYHRNCSEFIGGLFGYSFIRLAAK